MMEFLLGIPADLQSEASDLLLSMRMCGEWRSVDNLSHHVTYALIVAGYVEYRLAGEQCYIRALSISMRERIRPFRS